MLPPVGLVVLILAQPGHVCGQLACLDAPAPAYLDAHDFAGSYQLVHLGSPDMQDACRLLAWVPQLM